MIITRLVRNLVRFVLVYRKTLADAEGKALLFSTPKSGTRHNEYVLKTGNQPLHMRYRDFCAPV